MGQPFQNTAVATVWQLLRPRTGALRLNRSERRAEGGVGLRARHRWISLLAGRRILLKLPADAAVSAHS